MKRIIMAISVLAITALLSACGAGASPTNVAPETNQDSYSDLLLSEDSFSVPPFDGILAIIINH